MDDLRQLARYFRPYKTSLVIGIACILAGVIFNVTIPLIVLVLYFQRRIVEGLTAGAVKG